MAGPQEDYEKARERAEENGTTVYEELENEGWTRNEIRDEFSDMYKEDPELDAYLNETDSSVSNEELGLDEEGVREDD